MMKIWQFVLWWIPCHYRNHPNFSGSFLYVAAETCAKLSWTQVTRHRNTYTGKGLAHKSAAKVHTISSAIMNNVVWCGKCIGTSIYKSNHEHFQRNKYFVSYILYISNNQAFTKQTLVFFSFHVLVNCNIRSIIKWDWLAYLEVI